MPVELFSRLVYASEKVVALAVGEVSAVMGWKVPEIIKRWYQCE